MIPDVASVKEALAKLEDRVPPGWTPYNAEVTVRAAARAWVDLMERGETVWWCEVHDSLTGDRIIDHASTCFLVVSNGEWFAHPCHFTASLRVPLVSPSPYRGG